MYPSSLNTVWYLPVGRLQILKNWQTCSCHEIILQVTRWIILFSSHNWTPPPCTDREYGIQLFLQLGSALAAQTPTISVCDFETSNGEMPWYPGGGADFLNDYATRSTTTSGVPKDSQDSQVKFLQDWMMADCSIVHNLLQLLWRDTDSHQWKKLSRCSRYRCSASHIPWCFRILCSCHQQPCYSISFQPHACNEHGKNKALGQGMQEHDYHPCVSNQIASLKGSQWLPKVAPLLLLLLTLSYMPPDENW